jgi:hypothetical protein
VDDSPGWVYERFLTRAAKQGRTVHARVVQDSLKVADVWLDPVTGVSSDTPLPHTVGDTYLLAHPDPDDSGQPYSWHQPALSADGPNFILRNGEPVGTIPAAQGSGWSQNKVLGDLVIRSRPQDRGLLWVEAYRATGERKWARQVSVDFLPN